MRAPRIFVASAALFLALAASPAAAQEGGTTTTAPPVRSIPVTGGGGSPAPTTNANPAPDLASTGVAADALVPFGFGLIALGAGLEAMARRRRLALRWG